MGYTVYTESINRTGYRPVGESNAFAATHLGGVPFRRELLRGMGQQHPFTDSGGYILRADLPHTTHSCRGGCPCDHCAPRKSKGGLSGLGAIIPDQSLVTYQGTWQNNYQALDLSTQDVVNTVTAALIQDGLNVRSVSIGGGAISQFLNEPFTVTLQLQVSNGMGFGDPNDLISIVRHEVYVATGNFPLNDSIPVMTTPGAPGPVSTGQPALANAPQPPGSPVTAALWLEQNALWLGLGVGALVLLPALLGKV